MKPAVVFVIVLIDVLLMIYILSLVARPIKAHAHDWYPTECCQDEHCYPVKWVADTKEGTTVITSDGVQVTVPLAVPRKGSPDGGYHLCFQKETLRLFHILEIFCFFVPGQA